MFGKKNIVKFKVDGKPPKKGTDESIQAERQGKSVFILREKALETRKKAGLGKCFEVPVKFTLTIFAQNITQRKDSEDYVGDLDSFIAGVLDSLQPPPEHPDFDINPIFKERDDIGLKVPLIIEDDSQVVQVTAKKESTTNKPFYKVVIEPAQ